MERRAAHTFERGPLNNGMASKIKPVAVKYSTHLQRSEVTTAQRELIKLKRICKCIGKKDGALKLAAEISTSLTGVE